MEHYHNESWKPIFDCYVDDGQPVVELNWSMIATIIPELNRYSAWAREKGVSLPSQFMALTHHLKNLQSH